MNNNQLKDLVIVGGGSSAWMSACYLKKSYPNLNVTIVESPTKPRIGVGEATIPNFQSAFWDQLGIPEDVWMRRIKATFKMGIKFVNWKNNPTNEDDYFYHVFGILPHHKEIPMAHYWAYNMVTHVI